MKTHPRPGCLDAALTLLKFRGRSERDMRDRLRKKGYSAADIDAALHRLKELKLIDDASLADVLAGSARRSGHGRHRVTRDLLKRGFDKDTADAAAVADRAEEKERAAALIKKRLPALRDLDAGARYRRLSGLLARRGFDADVIRGLLKNLFSKNADLFEGEMEP